jgi:acyl-CoA dehydrogenase
MRADDMLVETIGKIFEEHCTPERIGAAEGGLDADLWTLLEQNGLTLVGVPEERGGSGGTLHDAAALMVASGYHAAPIPLADSLVGARLLAASGHPVGEGTHIAVSGVRVPWLAEAAVIVGDPSSSSSASTNLTTLTAADVARSGRNYAGDPYVVLQTVPDPAAVRVACEQMALARSLQIAGALQRVSDLCVQYATEREQFGKPIGKQQILQHYLAHIAGEAVTAQAAADNAVDLMAVGVDPAELTLAIAAAKTVASRSVGSVNKLAHQLHGAIGYTDEHRLQLWTRRLWSWRDDFGTETQWGAVFGRALAVRGGESLWPLITSWPRTMV